MAYKEWGAVILKPGCSNYCVFCRMIPRVDPRELKKQELNVAKNLVDLKMQGVNNIDISGNDPIEYDKIVPLIKYIKELGFDFIQLSTHGRNLSNEKLLKEIIDSPLNKLRIPLYGSKPRTHDAVTQSDGSFEETLNGLKKVMGKNKNIEIQISFLIMDQNKNDVIDFIKLMKELKISDYYISIPFIKNDDYSYYVPLKDLRNYIRPAFVYTKKYSLQAKFMEIPFCVLGEYNENIDNKTLPPNMGEHCQPRKEFKTEIKDMPSYRLKKKAAMCENCEYFDYCDGFPANDIDMNGTGNLKPIQNKKKFIDSISEEEWAQNGHTKEDAEIILKIYEDLISFILPGKLLDLGCGTGIFSRYLTTFSDKKINTKGIDINPQAIEYAEKKYQNSKQKLKIANLFELEPESINNYNSILISVGDTDKSFTSNIIEFLNINYKNFKKNIRIIILCYDKINIDTREKIADLNSKFKIELINNKFFILEKNI